MKIAAVEVPPPRGGLRGCHLGVPKAGERVDPRNLLLRGWALAEAPALAVEVECDGAVVGRAVLDRPRSDIAAEHEDLPHADSCGFELELDLAGLDVATQLSVRAVLDPISRVPIATIAVEPEATATAETVKVVIPCFRQAHFLPEAIESVLAQDHRPVAVIVVDDGSPDNASEVAARYPGVDCLRQPNGGLAAARNAGLERVATDFVLFLDADDRLLPDAISRGLSELAAEPGAMMAAGAWEVIGEEGEPIAADPLQPPEQAFPALLESCFISTPAAVLFRRALFAEIGGFDSGVSASADYDLYLRAAARFPVRLHDHSVAEYRRHGANMTRDPELIMASELQVLGRQASAVRDSPELTAALSRGLARIRAYHGERIALYRGD